jgi:hypothetical protein
MFALLNSSEIFFPNDESENVLAGFAEIQQLIKKSVNITNGHCHFTYTLEYKDITLFFNGKLTNVNCLKKHVQYDETDFVNHSANFEEGLVVILLYIRFGLKYLLNVLEGRYVFMLLDQNVYSTNSKLYVVRDPFGHLPLYVLMPVHRANVGNHSHMLREKDLYVKRNPRQKMYGFASETEYLEYLCETGKYRDSEANPYMIVPFPAGTYTEFSYPYRVLSSWSVVNEFVPFFHLPKTQFVGAVDRVSLEMAADFLRNQLIDVVRQILDNRDSDVPPTMLITTNSADILLLGILIRLYRAKCGEASRVRTVCFTGEDCANCEKIAQYYDTDHITIDRENYGAFLLTQTADMFTAETAISEVEYQKSDLLTYDYDCRNRVLNYFSEGKVCEIEQSAVHLEWHRPFLNEKYLNFYFSLPLEIRGSRDIVKQETSFTLEEYRP